MTSRLSFSMISRGGPFGVPNLLPSTGFLARNALAGCRHIRRFWGISEQH